MSRYLKLFTFLPLHDIDAVMAEHEQNPSARVAQRKLAREVSEIVHGEESTRAVEAQHGILFSRSKTALRKEARTARHSHEESPPKKNASDINFLLNKAALPDKPSAAGQVILPRSMVFNQQIGRIFHAAGLVASRSEGHRLSAAKGAHIGSLPGIQHGGMPDHVEFTPALNWRDNYVNNFIIDGKLLIIRAGKWKVKIIKIVEDEEYERLGLDAPGWVQLKQQLRDQGKLSPQVGEHENTGEAQDALTS